MNSMATEQNSPICSEEGCLIPAADSYLWGEDIYTLRSEEAVNMTLKRIPWNKGKVGVYSEQTLIKISLSKKGKPSPKKGKPVSQSQKEKQSETMKIKYAKGAVPWNKGMKGIHLSPETEFKEGNVSCSKGKPKSEETKERMSTSHKMRYIMGVWKSPTKNGHTEAARQKMSKSKKGNYIGEQNPNWRGGISFEPYCQKFNKHLKEQVRKRDNRTCQLCGAKENGKKLHVHHIHYDKKNCDPDLITVCNSCNTKVNYNRDYWEAYFVNLLIDRGLKYVFPVWWV